MSSPHVEVIPRIIDTSIAATYQASPTSQSTPASVVADNVVEVVAQSAPIQEVVAKAPATFTQKFFSTLKDYLIPILFIISVIVVVYIMWKYWTSYRNVSVAAVEVQPDHSTVKEPLVNKGFQKPKEIQEDLSKYILNSQSDVESVRSRLSTVDEENEPSESSDQDEEDEGSDEEGECSDDEGSDGDHASLPSLFCESDDEDNQSAISEPDFNMISSLINSPIEEDHTHSRFEYLESIEDQPDTDLEEKKEDNDDENREEDNGDHEIRAPVQPKRSKRTKRVVL